MSSDSPFSLLHLQTNLDVENDKRDAIREVVRQLDRDVKSCVALLSRVQNGRDKGKDNTLVQESGVILKERVKETLAKLTAVIPEYEFWRWSNMWFNSVSSACYCVAMKEWLVNGTCVTKEQVVEELGVNPESKQLTITTEEYLRGLLSLMNELSRLSINAASLGDYTTPVQISKFGRELFAAFQMLELKNDSLRRSVDGLKYDIKKTEEVVYDLSVRGLIKDQNLRA